MKSKVAVVFFCIISIVLGLFAGAVGNHLITLPSKRDPLIYGDLSIHFLELGNKWVGDCTYIKYGDIDILIDAGSRNNSASAIIEYIDPFVEDDTLEYVIATHAHEDHISGFYSQGSTIGIFEKYSVGTIIDFPNTNKTNYSNSTVIGKYVNARNAEVEAGAKHYTALECYNNEGDAKRVWNLAEGLELEILYNYYYDHSYSTGENNFSVCAMINQDDNHYIFTGDLEEAGERKLVEHYETMGGLPKCALYKGGHHGSGTSSCDEFLLDIDPDYVCICSCAGTAEYTDNNDTQFPTQEFIDRIAPYTDAIYVTSMVDNYVSKDEWDSLGTVKSMNGNIVFNVINGTFTISCSNNNLILKDTEWFKSNRTTPSAWVA